MTEPTPGATETEPAAPVEQPEPPAVGAEETPDALKAEIARLRRENASARVQAKQNAADEARQELAQQIGKALGLVAEDEPADPARLTEQITAKDAEARQAKVELAVYRAAVASDADPAALLDSRAFLEKVAALDPTDSPGIATAITEAVAANPRLARSQPQRMQPNPAQGTSAQPPLGINERIAEAERAGDVKTAIRLKASKAINTNQ